MGRCVKCSEFLPPILSLKVPASLSFKSYEYRAVLMIGTTIVLTTVLSEACLHGDWLFDDIFQDKAVEEVASFSLDLSSAI